MIEGTAGYKEIMRMNHGNFCIRWALRVVQYGVCDHFRRGNVPVNQIKLRMCHHFDQTRTWHRCLKHSGFLRLVHLCKVFENCSIRLSND